MPERLTEDSESLFLLRTPAASEAERGHQPEDKAKARGGQVTLSGQFMHLATPNTMDSLPARTGEAYEKNLRNGNRKNRQASGNLREQVIHNLPTPTVADTFTDQLKSSQQKDGLMHSVNLSQAVHMTWGRFEPAVKRWEAIIGHPAPAPTEATGKDGAPRLSSKFTEWMMGLEPGWITGMGLSRKDELKACGNGVVPQQAKLALERLKARFEVE
jgi:hypothetical protein